MIQIPLSDLDIASGRAVEWTLRPPADKSATGTDPQQKTASYNQEKHFSAAVAGQAENAPEKNWVAMTFEIPGRLDLEALDSALHVFVRRHEVLRCTFEQLSGNLRCDIMPPEEVVLDRFDVGRFDSADQGRSYLAQRFNDTISPLGWPLFRVGVVIGDNRSTVYLAYDHIVCDGMSLVVAVHEVETAYEAIVAGEAVELPVVGSYLDFGDQQRARYASLTANSPELAYWRSFVASNGDFFPRIPLDLGVDEGRMYPATNETAKLLDDAQAAAFEQECRAGGGKLFMGVLAAAGMALAEVSGCDTYRGLMPVSERKVQPWTNSFGWFVNTMPIEFSVAAGKDFRAVLDGVRAGWAELVKHIDVPFIKAWELLAPHYFALRTWPFPANFFSFIDYRKMAGAEHYGRWRPTTIPEASHSNTGNMWFLRNADGVYMNTIFSDTPEARAAMTVYRAVIARVLRDVAAGDAQALPASSAADAA